MAKQTSTETPEPVNTVQSLVGALEQALAAVKAAKFVSDEAAAFAAEKAASYQAAIRTAQKARSEYDAHVNEAMSGFAQVHQ